MSQLGTTSETTNPSGELLEWEPPMPPTDLIFDDGEPMESNRHRIAMTLLIDSLEEYWSDREDFFVGGNMFVYYSSEQARNRDFKGPDFFVVLNVEENRSRQGWVVWQENGRYPDVIIELTSPTTKQNDLTTKKAIYEQIFKTREYVIFDPFEPLSLQGYSLDNHWRYEAKTADERGWLWCENLGLWLGTWYGTILRETATWLRFYDPDGNLVLSPRDKAKTERQRAETEAQRAETERQRAETEAQKAETERQRAETEAQRAERLAARLRELGFSEE